MTISRIAPHTTAWLHPRAWLVVLLVILAALGHAGSITSAAPIGEYSYEEPVDVVSRAHDASASFTTPPATSPIDAAHGHDDGTQFSRWRMRASNLRHAAKGAESAYDVAAAGGRHAGFLKNYVGRSPAELDRGIGSIERQIAEHEQAIANPASKVPNFHELDPRQQEALVTRKWPGDIQRQREQLEILKRLRQGG